VIKFSLPLKNERVASMVTINKELWSLKLKLTVWSKQKWE